MEHQKDIQRNKNKGQNDSTSDMHAFVLRKAQKLTTAIYIVTDILSDMEPMKWSARESSVEILREVSLSVTSARVDRTGVRRTVLEKIEAIMALLDVTASAHILSEMNVAMINTEYQILKDNIVAGHTHAENKNRSLLSEHFFMTPLITEPTEGKSQLSERRMVVPMAPTTSGAGASSHSTSTFLRSTQPVEKNLASAIPVAPSATHQSRTTAVEVAEGNEENDTQEKQATETEIELPQKEKIHTEVVTHVEVPTADIVRHEQTHRLVLTDKDVIARAKPDVNRDDRRTIIFALLKQKPAITVIDIAKSISGVSEKTIQRELLAMVNSNILIKKGERRWSTYSLREF
jgi:hypothetical protein